MTRIIFSVDNKLHAEFKAYCAQQKESMTKILIGLIKTEIGYKDSIEYDNYKEVLTND